MSVEIDDIRRAAEQMAGFVVATPCRHSTTLSSILGAEVFIKFENLQFTASFKDRGALIKLLRLSETERRQGVIAMSAGNHAQGVAYHAQRLGIPSTIVMPEGTPNIKIRQTEQLGATVVVSGESIDESALYAEQLREENNYTFVHPFDDEAVIAGQGTVALEMLESYPEIDCLVAPIGGGGLVAGMSIAAKAVKPEIEIFGAETELFPSVHNALSGRSDACGGQTIADGIAVKTPGELAMPIIEQHVADVLLVPESDIERAINLYLTVEKTVAEGAGAVSMAALISHPDRFRGRKVGLVLSGGNIDTRILASILMRGLIREGRIARLRVEIPDRPGVLSDVSRIIGAGGGNILEVQHQRMFIDVPARLAELEIVVECRDSEQVKELVKDLRADGYSVMRFAN